MKKIVIYQENSDPITLLDNDSSDMESYSNDTSKILELSKVCILETTSGNILIKPSKINSIFITDLVDPKNLKLPKEKIVHVDKKVSTQTDLIKD